ncbi:MAG: rhodanese-like domain-containing protein [Hyalangium sp.]|uniref:rhodanese-like domain-containing protein n=1 Tax=Hyalangium sp. TaxID=2028555 RepID=UPI00389A45F5
MNRRSFVSAGALVALMAVTGGCHDAQNRPAPSAEAAEKESFGRLSVDEVAKLVESGTASIFDNNSQEHWQKGHVPGAKWVAFNKVQASDLPADKSRQLVFYCANER